MWGHPRPIVRPAASTWARLIAELHRGLSRGAAAGSAGISPRTLERWRVAARGGDELARELNDEIDTAFAVGEARLEELGAAGAEMDPRLALAMLTRRDGLAVAREKMRTLAVERRLLAVKLERERLELEQLREDLKPSTDGEGW